MSPNQNRNLSDRLIRIIESDAKELTKSTVQKLQLSPQTESYHNLPYSELYNRCYEVYRDFGRWLWQKPNAIQAWYNELGEKRWEEGIPLAEVLWALVLTKDRLTEYLDACGLVDSAMELYQQQEFYRMVGHFFDRAICYTAVGYERRACEQGKSSADGRKLRLSRTLWPQPGLFRGVHHRHS